MAGVQAQASRREHQSMVPSSSPTASTSSSSFSSPSLLATAAAAALLLCSSLFVSPASAAEFVAPGAMVEQQLQPPPSRAQGLARSRRAGGGGAPSPSPPSPPASIELLSGRVRVADGDTIEITSDDPDGTTTKHKVRIWGIDAPETKQLCGQDNNDECGKRATERMRQVLGETATCEVKARDQYGRAVARCFPGIRSEKELDDDDDDTVVDAGLELITSGNAVAYSKYSKGFYEPFEKVARDNKVGIWAGEFEMPEDWRRQRRIETLQGVAAQRAAASPATASPDKSAGGPPPALNPKPSRPSPPTPAAPTRTPSSHKEGEEHEAGCDIKGNISSKNAKLFHLPGSLFYDAVKIDEAKGERWFCSEEEAREAGWEKAKYGGRPSQKDKEQNAGSDEGGGGGAAAPSTDAEVEAAADDEEEGEEGARN